MHEHGMSTALAVRHRLKVRYAETDQMGVVYHANYLIWFNDARDALLSSQQVNIARLEREGYRFPLVEVSCRYLAPARYGDDIEVCAWLLRESVARMRFRFEVRQVRSGQLLATGHSTSVMTDSRLKLLLRVPAPLQACFDRVAPGAHAVQPRPEGKR